MYTCEYSAWEGNLHVLKWARQHGCLWNSRTCAFAALGGHLDVLKWLRQHGCPWDGWTIQKAAEEGNFELRDWAIKNGCTTTSASTEFQLSNSPNDEFLRVLDN